MALWRRTGLPEAVWNAEIRDRRGHYVATPADLPAAWGEGLSENDELSRMRRIADYIAGMTDRYALIEHARYFPNTPELR